MCALPSLNIRWVFKNTPASSQLSLPAVYGVGCHTRQTRPFRPAASEKNRSKNFQTAKKCEGSASLTLCVPVEYEYCDMTPSHFSLKASALLDPGPESPAPAQMRLRRHARPNRRVRRMSQESGFNAKLETWNPDFGTIPRFLLSCMTSCMHQANRLMPPRVPSWSRALVMISPR